MGLRFDRQYEPHEFIEGDPHSSIWIVGLNPAEDPAWVDPRQKSELRNYFANPAKIHSYFKQFKVVSKLLFNSLGKDRGVAHTDLVKCSSYSWPPDNATGADRAKIIANCVGYLQRQIDNYGPEALICNGSEVSAEVRRLLPPPGGTPQNATHYLHVGPTGKAVTVVLSGFIGRIDNYAKRRLGLEIEALLSHALSGVPPNPSFKQTPDGAA